MKLKTEMVHASRAHYPVFLGDRQPGDIDHDVMAAHALIQALDDCTDKIFSKYARGLIEKRADAIMAGWTGADE